MVLVSVIRILGYLDIMMECLTVTVQCTAEWDKCKCVFFLRAFVRLQKSDIIYLSV